jgi:hypothetical protein
MTRLIYFNFKAFVPINCKTDKNFTTLFFIIGSGRSGNTLLRAILSTHKRIVIPPEFYNLKKLILSLLKNRHLCWDDLCVVATNIFFSSPHVETWGIYKNDMITELKNYDKIDQNISNLVLSFHKYYTRSFSDKKDIIIGDKTPLNSFAVFLINELYPTAKYIHVYRDGRDVVLSFKKAKIKDTFIGAAHRWNNSISMILKFQKKINNSFKIFSYSYENFVLDNVKTLKKICKFLEIDFDERLLTDYQNQFDKLGDTIKHVHHKNVKHRIFKSSINNWKSIPPNEQKEFSKIIPIIKKNLEKLGYKSNFRFQ